MHPLVCSGYQKFSYILTLREQVKPARSWSPELIPCDDGDGINSGLQRQNLPDSGPVRKVSYYNRQIEAIG